MRLCTEQAGATYRCFGHFDGLEIPLVLHLQGLLGALDGSGALHLSGGLLHVLQERSRLYLLVRFWRARGAAADWLLNAALQSDTVSHRQRVGHARDVHMQPTRTFLPSLLCHHMVSV